MPKPTMGEIRAAMEELEQAMIQSMEADREVEESNLKKQAARKRLSMARNAIHDINFY